MVWVVGLTGGIGSGKSVIADTFAKLGVPVIDSDQIARQLVLPNTACFKEILDHFGPAILNSNHEIDRRQLRTLVFNNTVERRWLENLLHPEIKKAIQLEIQKLHSTYCIVVIPLLAEQLVHYRDMLSHIIVVETTPERQIAFSKQRDFSTVEDIKKIMDVQATPEERRKIADTLIFNDGTIEDIQEKVLLLHQTFMKK